jgi:hypothetical protein
MQDNRKDQVVEEFQRRRKYMLYSFVLCMALIGVGLLLMQVADLSPTFLGLPSRGWKLLASAQLIAAVLSALMGFNQYRCPSCLEIVRGHDQYYLGVINTPDRCPNCGARLS